MTPWVKRLILANVVMYVITMYVPALRSALALMPAFVLLRPWTLITYMFLHAGLWHLLFNMLALFFFGPRLEALLGGRDFLRLYVWSGLGGALLFVITTIIRVSTGVGAPYTAVVGASGAVFGVLYGFARYWPREPIYLWGVLPVQARILVIVFAVMSLYAGIIGAQDGIAHFAHLGGFVGGILFLRWRDHRRRQWFSAPPRTAPITRVADEVRADIRRWEQIPRERLHEINRSEVDRILAKLKESGFASLTPDERAFMDRMSQR